jgi:hypothetical protein
VRWSEERRTLIVVEGMSEEKNYTEVAVGSHGSRTFVPLLAELALTCGRKTEKNLNEVGRTQICKTSEERSKGSLNAKNDI